jgi:hypothetical protein
MRWVGGEAECAEGDVSKGFGESGAGECTSCDVGDDDDGKGTGKGVAYPKRERW